MAIIRIKRRDGSIAYQTKIGEGRGSRALALGEAVVEAVAKGVSLADTVLCGVDLRGARLAGGDFTRADFRYSDLREADFSGSRMAGANLEHSRAQAGIFRGANLEGADLGQVNASSTDLTGVRMGGAKLWGANFGHARCTRVSFEGCDLRRANFSYADAAAAVFRAARLEHAVFRNTHAQRADFTESVLWGADFTGADVSRSRLVASQVAALAAGLSQAELAERLADHPPQRVLYGYGIRMESPGTSRSCGVFQDLEHCRKSVESLNACGERMERAGEPGLLARGFAAALTEDAQVAESIAAGLTARAAVQLVEVHARAIPEGWREGRRLNDAPVYGYGVLDIGDLPTGAFFPSAAAAKAAAGECGRAVILTGELMEVVPEAGQETARAVAPRRETAKAAKRQGSGRPRPQGSEATR